MPLLKMLKQRINYWTCGKFADWVRGEKKPYALGWDEWEKWHENAKSKRPVRYWLAETGLKKLQNLIYYPSDLYHTIRIYMRNRWIDKIHYLKTGLKPGHYYDFDTRILYSLFNELKCFVEIELAGSYQVFQKKVKPCRSKEDGISYLNWAMSLLDEKGEPTPQADSAKEILELYNWWENYPNRPDPMEESGWSKLCEEYDGARFSIKDTESKKRSFEKLQELEDKQEKEEEDMLVRLIKIRKSLWT